jgi:nucleotide-binding universal stress UspA family protein
MSANKLLLALANQEDNKHLIVSAINLCTSQGLQLELLHVVPITPSLGAESSMLYGSTSIVNDSIYDDEVKHLTKTIEQEVENLGGSCDFEVNVEIGYIEAAVKSRLSQTSDYRYLMIGLTDTNMNFISQFFSTAVNLIHSSKVPVIAIPKDSTLDKKHKNHLMVVDSLSSVSKRTSIEAIDLACSLHSENIFHLFVKENSSQPVDRMLKENNGHSFEAEIEQIDFDNLYLSEEKSIKNILKSKFQDSNKKLDIEKVTYEAMVRYGDPKDKIKEAAQETSSDIVILGGRNHSLWNLFHPSHLSTVNQINLNKILVIVPTKNEDFDNEHKVAA